MAQPEGGEIGVPPTRKVAILLGVKERWIAGVTGMAAAGGGAAATFVSSNQAGATTLLLLGGLGGLMSLTGRVPDRIGREGVVHERDEAPATRALSDLLSDDDLPRSVREVVAEAVATEFAKRSEPTTGRVASAMSSEPAALGQKAREILYERTALGLLSACLPNDAAIGDVQISSGTGHRFDAIVHPRANATRERTLTNSVFVEVRSAVDDESVGRWLAQVRSRSNLVGAAGGIVIVPERADIVRSSLSQDDRMIVLDLPVRPSGPELEQISREWRDEIARFWDDTRAV